MLIASLFWLDVTLVATSRHLLVVDAPGAAAPVTAAACVLMMLPLLLATWVSAHIGHDLARWPRLLLPHAVLALLFGACAYPALLVAATWLDGSAGAAMRASDVRRWTALAIENAAHYLLLQGILTAAAYFVRARAEQALRERIARRYDQARLQALRMQTNPHFLFNALGAIAGLIRSDPDAAEAMVTRLGDLFRATLGNRDAEFVTLATELDLGTRYLEIQRTRFGDRFDFRIECEPEAIRAFIPPLLLQPLLENAAEHGLSGRDGRIVVDVHCACPDGGVRIVVRNHAARETRPARDPARGFGLENVRERLLAAFGAEASLVAEFAADGCFEARVRFPLRPAPRDDAGAS